MTLAFTIQDQPNGTAQPDLTPRLTRCVFSTNVHGDEACQISAPLSLAGAFGHYDQPGMPHAIISDGASQPFQGRIEDVAIRGNGADLGAFGYQRALGDAPYTALWSDSGVSRWRISQPAEAGMGVAMPERFQIDMNNRLSIAPQKNAVYTGAATQGRIRYDIPDKSSRQFVGISFDVGMFLPLGWIIDLYRYDSAGTYLSTIWTLNSTAALQTANVFLTFSACDVLVFALYPSANPTTYVGETGASYFHVTNPRIVTSTANAVNTTNTAGWVAGANVTINVGSSVRMYVGQRLYFNYGATSEVAIVSAVPSSTQVTVANIVTTVGAPGIPIQSHVIYADEIVEDIIGDISTLNPTQLLPDVNQVQSPALDLFDELYEDQLPNTILDRLIGLGDNTTPPRMWEWGVFGSRKLYFRPEGDAALTWYVDVSAIDVQRTIEQLINSAYAVYQDTDNRVLRSAIATDAESVARFALTRRQTVKTTTTSATQANVQRDGVIDDKADPAPRFGLTFAAIYNAGGGRVPIWLPRAGDTIVIRNLPPTISVDIDQVQTFRIARTSCDLLARTLTVEPLTPLPTMAALIARGLKGQTT